MKKRLFILLLLVLFLSNCNGQSLVELVNGTATPTSTATGTPTMIPSSTATPKPTATIQAAEVSMPKNFVEKQIPELGLSVWMPETWYYRYEEQGNTSAVFVTKEDIEEYGRFSTGFSINIIREIGDPATIVNNFIDSILMAETTKEVYSQDNRYLGNNDEILFRACYIDAEIEIDPKDPNPSKEKTIIYMAIANPDQKSVYLLFYESPTSEWEDAWLNYGIFISQSMIESIDNNLLSITSN